ncbi:hypothetical protein ACX93W_21790 [Paenibacillus sp. CAU 1782]
MRLKEIDLDLPYVGVSAEDYRLNWMSKRMTFRNECRHVAAMAERYLKEHRYKTPFSWKLMISCYSDLNKSQRKFVKSEVYEVKMKFDIIEYFSLPPEEKKWMIFNVLKEGVFEMIEEEGWNREHFVDVFLRMENEGLKNTYQPLKPLYNSKRNLKVAIVCDHEINEISMHLCVSDKNGKEIERKLVVSEIPNEWNFHIHLGKLQWTSENEVALINKNGIVVGTVQATTSIS